LGELEGAQEATLALAQSQSGNAREWLYLAHVYV
jgi:hypothetical protein